MQATFFFAFYWHLNVFKWDAYQKCKVWDGFNHVQLSYSNFLLLGRSPILRGGSGSGVEPVCCYQKVAVSSPLVYMSKCGQIPEPQTAPDVHHVHLNKLLSQK